MKFNINFLFITIFIILIIIFILYRPLHSKQDISDEVAQLELQIFKMYELNQSSSKLVATAQYAYKYSDRYEMFDMHIDEKSNGSVNRIEAGFALYKGDFLHLESGVQFLSDDDLEFRAEEVDYNQSTATIIVNSDFKAREAKSHFEGTQLHYNLETKKLFAKNVKAFYNLNGMEN